MEEKRFYVEYSEHESESGRYPFHIASDQGVGKLPGHWRVVFSGSFPECFEYIENHEERNE